MRFFAQNKTFSSAFRHFFVSFRTFFAQQAEIGRFGDIFAPIAEWLGEQEWRESKPR
jgi:hypothetical protein